MKKKSLKNNWQCKNNFRWDGPKVSSGQRGLAHPFSTTVQILPRLSMSASQKLLQLQSEARKCLRRPEAESWEERFWSQHFDGSTEQGPAWQEDFNNRARQKVEAQQSELGRGIQRVRLIFRGGDAGANVADCRCCCDIWYGWFKSPTNVAIYTGVCQTNCRLVAGRYATQNQEHSYYQSAYALQHGFRSLQTVPQRKT